MKQKTASKVSGAKDAKARSVFESNFRRYRKALVRELQFLKSVHCLHRQLREESRDRLHVLNLAPHFFLTVFWALDDKLTMFVAKFFDPRGERGLEDFIEFVRQHKKYFTNDELIQRGQGIDMDFLESTGPRADVATLLESDLSNLQSVQRTLLRKIKKRRDKYLAHYDEQFFEDLRPLGESEPDLGEVDKAVELAGEMVNRYSARFDGKVYEWKFGNVGDLERVLDLLETPVDVIE